MVNVCVLVIMVYVCSIADANNCLQQQHIRWRDWHIRFMVVNLFTFVIVDGAKVRRFHKCHNHTPMVY